VLCRLGARKRALLFALLPLAAALLFPGAAAAQDSWEYSPYQIRVWLAVRPSPAISAMRQADLRQSVEQWAAVYGGATWRLRAEPAPASIASTMLVALDELTADQITAVIRSGAGPDQAAAQGGAAGGSPSTRVPAALGPDEQAAPALDKLMLLSIQEQEGRYAVACRELDYRTRTLGMTQRIDVWQPALLTRAAGDVVAESFQALVRVEATHGKKATVRIRAGGLVRDENCPSSVRAGDLLRPIVRRNDLRGEPRPGGIQVLDWTYLLVRDVNEYLLECDVYSAMRNPLAGRSSRTVERMALKVRPRGTRTTLELVARGDSPDPLEGYEIFAKKPIAEEGPDVNPSVRLGLTDWRGRIDIEQSDLPLRLIYVKNGSYLVARIPLVPGFQPLETVPLVSDDKRLEAEAFVKGMETTVMDLVARRAILAARIRRRMTEGNVAEARVLLEEIKSLQTREDLERMLANRQAALASPDKRQQQRIDLLLTGTRSLLNKYLDPGEIVALEREVTGTAAPPAAEEPGA